MPGGHIQLVALTKRFTEVAVDGIDLTARALVQNDGGHPGHLAQGTPVLVYLAPDALRVLRGNAQIAAEEPDELKVS